METILIASILLIAGVLSAAFGYVLFRLLLPILGFIAGFSIGFSSVEGIFGTNAVSFFTATLIAFLLGALFALLSYAYYTIAIVLLGATIGAGLFALLAQAVGLRGDGFVTFMLSAAGAIIGALVVASNGLQHSLILYLSAFYGVGLILLATLVLVGDQTLGSIYTSGLTGAVSDVVTRSWVWMFAWIGGGFIAAIVQMNFIARVVSDTIFTINDSTVTK